MTRAHIANASAWLRFRSWLRDKLHRCRHCRIISTDEGIGGQCVTCGRIHGWMTREEIARADRMPHLISYPRIPGETP